MNELFLVCIGSFDFLSRSDSNRTDSFDILSDGDGTGDQYRPCPIVDFNNEFDIKFDTHFSSSENHFVMERN